ncbi:MAG: nicotinate phosphoribosyltransferase [Lachnospirales bacterium]
MRNLTMLTDFYQLTMMQGYFLKNYHNKITVFDMFFRKNPDGSSFSILCGIDELISYIESLTFTEDDIKYLEGFGIFQKEFLDYLLHFKFTGEILAFQEGSIILPMEPIIRVKAPIFECQLIETALLNIINHQSLIASKAQRVTTAAKDIPVLEFGLRRAQGPDAGIYGSRAAYIGGCVGTSNVLAGQIFDIPVSGTHAHSWVMSFENEYDAFLAYGELYRDNCILLVDTYNTLKSGIPNAIKAFDTLKARGELPKKIGIRLDSGDMSYLSKKCRELLDKAGYKDAIISASNDLDEYIIDGLLSQGAKIDLFGVGTNLITSKQTPAFGGVYKIAAIADEEGGFTNKIKLSNNAEKITNPGIKKVYRIYDKETKKIIVDLITLDHEIVNTNEDLVVFDPLAIWKKKHLKKDTYIAREMLVPLFVDGKFVSERKTSKEVKAYCLEEKATLWEESLRLLYPQLLYVDLSQELYDLKESLKC